MKVPEHREQNGKTRKVKVPGTATITLGELSKCAFMISVE